MRSPKNFGTATLDRLSVRHPLQGVLRSMMLNDRDREEFQATMTNVQKKPFFR